MLILVNGIFVLRGSVVSFLEDLEEMGQSRAVSESRLFESISEFLKDDALSWDRFRKSSLQSWGDFKSQLRNAFLPLDYEANLLDEIKYKLKNSFSIFQECKVCFVNLVRLLLRVNRLVLCVVIFSLILT